MRTQRNLVCISILGLILVGCGKKSATSGNSTSQDQASSTNNAPPESQPANTSQPVATTNPEPPPPAPSSGPETTAPPATTTPAPETAAPKPTETAKNTVPESDAAIGKSQPPPPPIVIPAGTPIVVRVDKTISTKTATPGSPFTATVAKPLVTPRGTIVPKGSPAEGVVATSKSPGKFKGEGVLTIKITKLSVHEITYPVVAKPFTVTLSGKGKRSGVMIGGGAAAGALIGGLAGGGKGAAIGALSGGGAGTAGAALTGNNELALPVESPVVFELLEPITLQSQPQSGTANTRAEPAPAEPQSSETSPSTK